jgi:hypothetical protein
MSRLMSACIEHEVQCVTGFNEGRSGTELDLSLAGSVFTQQSDLAVSTQLVSLFSIHFYIWRRS